MAVELKEDVRWVGVVDWELRRFHGHELSTHRGSSYNAYLILDEKTVLVDTVWGPFADQLIENIREIIEEHLKECKIPLIRDGIELKWQPREEELKTCREFGREIGTATKSE